VLAFKGTYYPLCYWISMSLWFCLTFRVRYRAEITFLHITNLRDANNLILRVKSQSELDPVVGCLKTSYHSPAMQLQAITKAKSFIKDHFSEQR
jgi:hypothetical protein